MQINRNGFVFRNAYAFKESDEQPVGNINGCTLLWRFAWFGFWRTILNVFLCCIIIILTILTPMMAVVSFFCGARLERRKLPQGGSDAPTLWEWVENIPEGLLAISYRARAIQSWPRIFGWRILPAVVIGLVFALWGEYLLWSYSLPNVLSQDASALDKWDILFCVQLTVITVAFIIACAILFVRQARESELAQLISAGYRSFKERTCPVVEIIE